MSNMDLKSTSPSTPNVYSLESAKGVHGLLHAMFLEIEYTSHTHVCMTETFKVDQKLPTSWCVFRP